MKSNWYTSKWVNVAGHVSIWVIIILFPFIPNDSGSGTNPFRNLNALTNIFRAGIFYLNAELLVPLLLYRKEIVVYLLSLLILFGAMMVFHGSMWSVLYPDITFHVF